MFDRPLPPYVRRFLCGALLLAVSPATGGCGFGRLEAAFPGVALANEVPNFNLSDLENIQDDQRLTTDEKLAQIREALGVPDDDDGNRIAQFLLTFNVP